MLFVKEKYLKIDDIVEEYVAENFAESIVPYLLETTKPKPDATKFKKIEKFCRKV